MNVEIVIPSLFNTKKKQGQNGTETQLGSSKFHLFVELFDTCMYAHCYVNCSKTVMLKVCLLSVS